MDQATKADEPLKRKGPPPPPVHSRFQPGQSGNVSGKRVVPEDLRKARALNQVELERMLNRLFYMERSEVKALLENAKTPMLEVIVARIMAIAASKGDHQRLEFILARMLPKLTQKVEVSTAPGTPLVLTTMSTEERILEIERLRKARELAGSD